MIGTYASALSICAASLLIGSAATRLCGRRRWSWTSPAVGLALLLGLCWGTVRLPGGGALSAAIVLATSIASALYLRGRLTGGSEALARGAPLATAALLAASIPFLVEGRFGILGTGFNPDMSQHLLAADELAGGAGSPLPGQGYPLGPHSVVVALHDALGIGPVQGFGGFTLAVSVLACLTALGALGRLAPWRTLLGGLLVGLPYMVASYLAQGAFKETSMALFFLAFAVGLRGLGRDAQEGEEGTAHSLIAVPPALIAAGSVYAYSFPGLTWLLGTAAIWALGSLALIAHSGGSARRAAAGATRPALLATLVFAVLTAPELGRIMDFARFETFDPSGPGLGNLFGQISPFEALGVWPSGDFRLTPGAGAVPAIVFYLGVALALVLLLRGLAWSLRQREIAVPAALAAALGAYAAARLGGTPYTAAKAVAMASPVAMLLIVRPLLALRSPSGGSEPGGIAGWLAATAFAAAAALCTALALGSAPVGPATYDPELTGLRPTIAASSTEVLAPTDLLEDQHGVPFLAWELRGGRVCIGPDDGGMLGKAAPPGVRFVIAAADRGGPPYRGLRPARRAGPWLLWQRVAPVRGPSHCPLIAVREARQGPETD